MKQLLYKNKLAYTILVAAFFVAPSLTKAQAFTDAVVDSVINLPVDFVSFIGVREDKNVVLNWKTATEINNIFFNVQRSYDGINFETIAKVYPSSAKQYSFTDINIVNSTLYYRIENVDKNGKTNYTNTVTIKNVVAKGEDWNIYPNPVTNNVINIETKSLPSGTYIFSLKNIKSESVFAKNIVINNSNNITIQLPSSIARGFYVLSICSSDGKINSSKKVILK